MAFFVALFFGKMIVKLIIKKGVQGMKVRFRIFFLIVRSVFGDVWGSFFVLP